MNKCIDPDIGNMIGRYEFDLLTPDEKQEFKAHLLKCDFCFQEVYEFSQSVKTIHENISDFRKAAAYKTSVISDFKEKLASIFPQTIRSFAPVVTFVVLAVIIISVSWFIIIRSTQTDVQLITEGEPTELILQQPEELEFKGSKQEFIKSDSLIKKLTETMHVQKSSDNRHIIFIWEKIEHIQKYIITLISKVDSIRITPAEGIIDTCFFYPVNNLKPDLTYIWQLTGILNNNEKINAQQQLNYDSY